MQTQNDSIFKLLAYIINHLGINRQLCDNFLVFRKTSGYYFQMYYKYWGPFAFTARKTNQDRAVPKLSRYA